MTPKQARMQMLLHGFKLGHAEDNKVLSGVTVTKGNSDKEGLSRMENTTLAVVMTNARLSQAECKRMAVNAHDGFARAIYPVHTPSDGDIVFVLASNEFDLNESGVQPLHLYTAAANTVTRAIARGVYEASL